MHGKRNARTPSLTRQDVRSSVTGSWLVPASRSAAAGRQPLRARCMRSP